MGPSPAGATAAASCRILPDIACSRIHVLLIIRPQQKVRRRTARPCLRVKKGDRFVMSSGLLRHRGGPVRAHRHRGRWPSRSRWSSSVRVGPDRAVSATRSRVGLYAGATSVSASSRDRGDRGVGVVSAPPRSTSNLGLDLQAHPSRARVDVDNALEAQVERAGDTVRVEPEEWHRGLQERAARDLRRRDPIASPQAGQRRSRRSPEVLGRLDRKESDQRRAVSDDPSSRAKTTQIRDWRAPGARDRSATGLPFGSPSPPSISRREPHPVPPRASQIRPGQGFDGKTSAPRVQAGGTTSPTDRYRVRSGIAGRDEIPLPATRGQGDPSRSARCRSWSRRRPT